VERVALEVSTDPQFLKAKTRRVEFDMFATAWMPDAPLGANTTYFWRVQGGTVQDNKMVWGAFSKTFSFRTPPGAASPTTMPLPADWYSEEHDVEGEKVTLAVRKAE